jgi:hypothetical protein
VGPKDDRRDAFVLGDSLRTDQPCFRSVRLDDPQIIRLRELSRVEEDLQREGNQLANRLREQLHRFYVQALELCPGAVGCSARQGRFSRLALNGRPAGNSCRAD